MNEAFTPCRRCGGPALDASAHDGRLPVRCASCDRNDEIELLGGPTDAVEVPHTKEDRREIKGLIRDLRKDERRRRIKNLLRGRWR